MHDTVAQASIPVISFCTWLPGLFSARNTTSQLSGRSTTVKRRPMMTPRRSVSRSRTWPLARRDRWRATANQTTAAAT